MACDFVQKIGEDECIGDSLITINQNFANLNTLLCELSASLLTTTMAPYTKISYKTAGAVTNAKNATSQIVFTTEVVDTDNLFSISGGGVLVPAGTYDFSAKYAFGASEATKTNAWLLLKNATTNTDIDVSPLYHIEQYFEAAPFTGRFTVAAASTITLSIVLPNDGGSSAMDIPAGSTTRTISTLELWKVA